MDRHTLVEEREFAQTRAEDLPLECTAGEDRVVREERDLGAGLLAALADDFGRLGDVSARKLDVMDLAAALDVDLHPFGQRVDARDADAVETARDLVVGAVELAARVEDRQHHLERRTLLRRMHVDRDAAAVVLDGERAVGIDDDVDHRAIAGERLVNRVVDHFVHEVVIAALSRVADVHRGALAHRLHALKDLDVLGVIVARSLFAHFSHL